MMKRRNQTHLGQQTSGFADPKLDTFTDVKRALHAHLMRTDATYSKASRDASQRNERRKITNAA